MHESLLFQRRARRATPGLHTDRFRSDSDASRHKNGAAPIPRVDHPTTLRARFVRAATRTAPYRTPVMLARTQSRWCPSNSNRSLLTQTIHPSRHLTAAFLERPDRRVARRSPSVSWRRHVRKATGGAVVRAQPRGRGREIPKEHQRSPHAFSLTCHGTRQGESRSHPPAIGHELAKRVLVL